MRLIDTAIHSDSDTTIVRTSDEFDWPDLHISITSATPNGRERVLGGSKDLWVIMSIDPAPFEVTLLTAGREVELMLLQNQFGVCWSGQVVRCIWRSPARLLQVFVRRRLLSQLMGELFGGDVDDLAASLKLGLVDAGVVEILQMLRRSLFVPEQFCAFKMDLLSRALTVDLLQRHLERLPRPGAAQTNIRLTPSQIRTLVDYIHENMGSSLSIKELITLTGLGRTTFIKGFKASLGEAPYRFIMRSRIQEAQRLLAGTRLSIAEITARCGFHDQAHFSTAFRRETGMTPSAYRRMR